MKRFLCLLLALLTASTLACGGEGSTDGTTAADSSETTAAEAPDRLDELGERDFEGRTFMILDGNGALSQRQNSPEDTMNGDIVNDALFERDSALEERYNVNIEYTKIPNGGESHAAFKQSILAGDDAYQMIFTYLAWGTAVLSSDGVFANLADSEYLSLDENWWSRLMYENFSVNGIIYTTTGDIVPSMYQLPGCMFLNTDMAKDYNVTTDFVGLVRSGDWTIDAMLEATKGITRDVNNDGVMDVYNDIFGLSHPKYGSMFLEKMAISAGVQMSEVKDGEIVVDLANEHTISAIEKISKLLVRDIQFEGGEDFIIKAFAEDRALFTTHYTESATSFIRTSGMKSDYLILPMPKYDASQEDYHSAVNPWIDAFIGLSRLSDLEFTGFMAEAMGFYSYKHIRPLANDLMYDVKTSRNENTAEMLDVIFNTTYVDLNMAYNFGGSQDALRKAFEGSSITTEMAAISGTVEGDIAKLVEAWTK